MSPELPQNLKLGQISCTAGIVSQKEWSKLSRDEQDAVDALSWQIVWRCRQKRYPALEGEDSIFLTVRHVQRLLRAIGARKTGEKAAAAASRHHAGERLDRRHRSDEETAASFWNELADIGVAVCKSESGQGVEALEGASASCVDLLGEKTFTRLALRPPGSHAREGDSPRGIS